MKFRAIGITCETNFNIEHMKQSEIKELSVEDLKEKFNVFKKSYTDLKLAHAISPLETPMQLRTVRKTVARIATELTKRELQ